MRGSEAEDRALSFLQQQGLTLVERNWRCKAGELDLVMRDAEGLVITEVRARGRSDFGTAAETIGAHKRQRIVRAAQLWLLKHPRFADLPVRFDVVTFDGAEPAQWLRGAFETGD